MMENNNLLLYKLLCKDKVGGVRRGITVGKGREESGVREPQWEGSAGASAGIPPLCVRDANERRAIFI